MFELIKQLLLRKQERKEPRRIESSDSERCPFCGGTQVRGGSWTPDYCVNCHATYFFGAWGE